MSESNEAHSQEPFSDHAGRVAGDAGIDDVTAIRQLLTILIDVTENCMVTLWDISEALQLRTVAGKPRSDG